MCTVVRSDIYHAVGARDSGENTGGKSTAIDIGGLSPAFPVTPPDMRVRIRRFGELSYRLPVNLGIPSESK